MKIRIVIVDDHTVLRSGLRMLINSQPDMEVAGEATDGAEAVKKVRQIQPDVVLLDLTMPGQGGLPVLAGLRKACSDARVLVLTMHDDPAYVRSALAAGAAGYVVKTAADTELLTAIRAVVEGRTFVDLSINQHEVQDILSRKRARDAAGEEGVIRLLSEREREVLDLVAQGHTNQEVADRLGLSVKSVETYRARLMDKLGLQSRADLVRYALDCGILKPGKSAGLT